MFDITINKIGAYPILITGTGNYPILISGSIGTESSITVYTSSAAFIAKLQANYYLEQFGSYSGGTSPASPMSFTGGTPTFAYTQTAAGDFYILYEGALSTNNSNTPITAAISSGNVTAFGANYFATDLTEIVQTSGVTIKVTCNGTVTMSISPSAGTPKPFIGFIAVGQKINSVIQEITVGSGVYNSQDNVYAGIAA